MTATLTKLSPGAGAERLKRRAAILIDIRGGDEYARVRGFGGLAKLLAVTPWNRTEPA